MTVKLGPDLELHLASIDCGCILYSSDDGQVGVIIKADDADIEGWRGVEVMYR